MTRLDTARIGMLALLLAGCSEYDLAPDQSNVGEPNPPDIETPSHSDRIVQTTVAAVDVLWVIDNSCSMSQEQVLLADNFDGFMTYFLESGLDYHIGAVSTDMASSAQQGRLQPGGTPSALYIDPETSDPLGVFGDMVLMGTQGATTEQGRDAVYAALEPPDGPGGANAGFYRDDAGLAVIVISDEDDQSNDLSVSEFVDWAVNLKSDPEMVSFSSIVATESDVVDTSCPVGGQGTNYLALTTALGGVEWSICDEDWNQALQQLGIQAAGLQREFFLTHIPVEDTIEVTVEFEGEPVTPPEGGFDFTYDRSRNSVTFTEFVPEPLSEVFIDYELLYAHSPDELVDTGQ